MIALPLGGIGTGTISLGGRGNLRDWEMMNRPAKGFAPPDSFFAVYTEEPGGERRARALEGPIDEADYITGQKAAASPTTGCRAFARAVSRPPTRSARWSLPIRTCRSRPWCRVSIR